MILCLVVLSLGVTIPALGQDQTAAPKDTAASEEDQAEPAFLALRCPSPANPYQRHHDCVRKSFDSLKETLTQELYLQESLFNGNLTVAAGRLAAGNTFATIPVLGNYLNGGINGNPGSIPANDGTFTASPPGVEWGGQLTFNFTPTFQFAMGIFNTNPNAAAGADNRVDFSLQQGNSGVLWVTQFSYLYNQGLGATGLQGEYTLGGVQQRSIRRPQQSECDPAWYVPDLCHVPADAVPGRRAGQPEGSDSLGRGILLAHAEQEHYAVFRRGRVELPGPHPRPRKRYCLGGSDLRHL